MDITSIEKTVISTFMWGNANEFMELSQGLRPDMFYRHEHQLIFAMLSQWATEGRSMNDMLLMATEMERQGHPEVSIGYLMDLTTTNPPVIDIHSYILQIVDDYQRRTVKVLLDKALTETGDLTIPINSTIARTAEALLSNGGLSADTTIRLTSVLKQLHKRMLDNATGAHRDGFLTGFERIDAFGGLHTKDLIVIAGLSSHGKTALALTLAMNAVERSMARALIFSMEMDAMQIGARLLAVKANVPSNVILYRQLKEHGQHDVNQGIERMQPLAERVFIGESSIQTLDAILGSIRLHHARYGTRLVIVDYLQILAVSRSRENSREQALADIARQLKNIAKELDICVILLSQLNRDGIAMGHPEPSSSQIRGSGQINEAADLTLLVYRPEVLGSNYRPPHDSVPTKGTALLKIEKDRNGGYGGLGSFITEFNGPLTWFAQRG